MAKNNYHQILNKRLSYHEKKYNLKYNFWVKKGKWNEIGVTLNYKKNHSERILLENLDLGQRLAIYQHFFRIELRNFNNADRTLLWSYPQIFSWEFQILSLQLNFLNKESDLNKISVKIKKGPKKSIKGEKLGTTQKKRKVKEF